MFYLSKFCRICIKTDQNLLNINSEDYDHIKLSEKLEVCTKMVYIQKLSFLMWDSIDFLSQVINKESLSTEICMSCVQKLRVSYDFQNMCKQSSKVLQGYLAELLSVSNKITPEQFVNSDLRVTLHPITKLLRNRKKRVSKEQRCSLLKKLLLKTKESTSDFENNQQSNTIEKSNNNSSNKGGLRDLLNFTKNYDFGFKIDSYKNYGDSPLERLSDFSQNYFFTNSTDFKDQILCVIDNDSLTCDSEEEELMYILENENNNEIVSVKVEELIIEPDIKIKREYDFECEDEENFESTYDYSSSLVEVCYDSDTNVKIKEEPVHLHDPYKLLTNTIPKSLSQTNFIGQNQFLAEIIPIVPSSSTSSNLPFNNNISEKYKTLRSVLNTPLNLNHGPPPTQLLDQFVARFAPNTKCSMSRHSIRCRTKGNPYINPQLQKQFQLRSFKCNTCNRRFKSPGYLNAHIVKLKH